MEFPDNWNGKTHRLVFHLLYNTGIRQAELINLKEAHIDTGNSTIKVLGKGNKERILPVSNELSQLIKKYVTDKQTELVLADTEILLVNEKTLS
jgi:integrase/recombinase XerC